MRKLFSSLILAGALLAAGSPAFAQAAAKLGYINSQAIIAQAPGAAEAQQAFEKDMAGFRTELQKLEQELKTMMDEYQQKQVMLSPEARQQQQQAIQQKQQQYMQRQGELEQRAAQRQAELVEPIMARIEQVIDAIRKEGGYALIFDVAEGGIVAADPSLDLTGQVLERLKTTTTASQQQP